MSICKDCFHSYVCEQFNEHRECDNTKCHFFNDHFISTADVVEVVRCKDCKHCEHINDGFAKDWWQCQRRGNSFRRKPDDYCSYGELKEQSK